MEKKILKFLIQVLGILLIALGLPFFPTGGFILVVLGVLCFRVDKPRKKKVKIKKVVEIPQPQKIITSQIAPITPPQPITTPTADKSKNDTEYKIETHKVAGVSYRVDEIASLGLENEDYNYSKKELIELGYEGERIYQYEFYPTKTELIPEPDNPHDPNAVKVIVDNVHVGYIKSGSCRHILNLLKNNRITKIDCEIGGGKYKSLEYDLYEDKYNLEKSESQIFVHLKLSVK